MFLRLVKVHGQAPQIHPQTQQNGHWRLSIPAAFSNTGNRQQLFFKTHKEAKNAADHWKQQAANFGKKSCVIKPSLAKAAVQAERTAGVHERADGLRSCDSELEERGVETGDWTMRPLTFFFFLQNKLRVRTGHSRRC